MNAKDVSEGWICAGSRVCARAQRKDAEEEGGPLGTPRVNSPIYWAEQDLASRRCRWLPHLVLIIERVCARTHVCDAGRR